MCVRFRTGIERGSRLHALGEGRKGREAGGGEPNIDSQIEVASICPFSRNEGKGKRGGAEVKGKIFFWQPDDSPEGSAREKSRACFFGRSPRGPS